MREPETGTWSQIKAKRMSKTLACQSCKSWDVQDAHHALFNRRKGSPHYDTTFNMMLVCKFCHSYKVKKDSKKEQHIRWCVDTYGWDAFYDWLRNMPDEVWRAKKDMIQWYLKVAMEHWVRSKKI